MFYDTLLIIHFIGLMLGAAGGISSGLIMRRVAKAPPEQAAPVRSLGPMLARTSTIGLALMWATGVAMVAWRGGLESLPQLFWVKFAFVLSLTAAGLMGEYCYAQLKRGNVKAAARLPILGPIAGTSSLLAVIFAVLAFH